MPEGPEVIITTQYLKTKIRNKKIVSIEVLDERFKQNNIKEYYIALHSTPLTIDTIDSKGKFMWIKLVDKTGSNMYMLNSFGLTGRWSFFKEDNSRLKFVISSNRDPNKKYNLYYVDNLKYGKFEFTTDPKVLQKKLDKLAPDVIKGGLTDTDLLNIMKRFNEKSRKGKNIVKVLLDQNAIVSGIGNYLVAECLYDAKIDPRRDLNSLSEDELKTLAHSIRKVCKHAYYKNSTGYMKHFKIFMKTHAERIDRGVFPDYLPDIKITSPFEFKVYKKPYDPNNNKVITDALVKGRRMYWVPSVQK